MQIITTLAGANFRPAEARDIVKESAIGDPVELEPDPSNAYDSSAVKVMAYGQHIGFVAKKDNGPLFEHLTQGGEASATIIAFETSLKPILEINL